MGNDRADLETTDLRFARAPATRLAAVRRGGLPVVPGALHARLADAEAARQPGEHILVVDGRAADARHLPPEAFANLTPLRQPVAVDAAGGIVVRDADPEPAVLLIFRREAWDLPKGKRDRGESLERCAEREVTEELGVTRLALLAPAGTTVHGYPEDEHFVVKETHWFLMTTADRLFRPEAREGIEHVAWLPWSEAVAWLDYDSLRRHLAALGVDGARAALARLAEAG